MHYVASGHLMCKVCIKSPCTVSTALLALIEVHGLLIQTLILKKTPHSVWSEALLHYERLRAITFFPRCLAVATKTLKALRWAALGIQEPKRRHPSTLRGHKCNQPLLNAGILSFFSASCLLSSPLLSGRLNLCRWMMMTTTTIPQYKCITRLV